MHIDVEYHGEDDRGEKLWAFRTRIDGETDRGLGGSFMAAMYKGIISVHKEIMNNYEISTPEQRLEAHRFLEHMFNHLAHSWKVESNYMSDGGSGCPSYQAIMYMGDHAIPYILRDLRDNGPDHWFVALRTIVAITSGLEPPEIPEEARGKMDVVTDIWLEWGEHHGLITLEDPEKGEKEEMKK